MTYIEKTYKAVLDSMEECFRSHLEDSEGLNNLNETKGWLEGWTCGATDSIIHLGFDALRDPAMELLQSIYDEQAKKYN